MTRFSAPSITSSNRVARITRRFPKDQNGRSLADFQLNKRLFKYRCSYMIYSKAFDSLPERVKSAVLSQLRRVLESDPDTGNHPSIKASERRKITEILAKTLPAWRKTER